MRHFSESVYPADVQDAHLLTSKLRLSQLLQFWARDLHQKPCLRHTMVLLDLRVVHSQVDTSTLQAKTQASITPPQLATDNQLVLKVDDYTMTRANSFCTAPVTGISCALIEELPTMALPIPDIMTLPMDVEDCRNFML